MESCQIRPVASADLEILDDTFRSEFDRTHADDLVDHNAGLKAYFVAWIGLQPAGHIFVNWQGPRQVEPFAAFPECPEINRLHVLDAFQNRGIASALIAECEAEARAKGFEQIGLGTDPAVPANSNLYYRLGYVDSGIGIFDDVYKVRDSVGSILTIREDTKFLIKELELTRLR